MTENDLDSTVVNILSGNEIFLLLWVLPLSLSSIDNPPWYPWVVRITFPVTAYLGELSFFSVHHKCIQTSDLSVRGPTRFDVV